MKFACCTMVAPGKALAEQCAAIAAGGCQGIETIIFPDTPLEEWQYAVTAATTEAGVELVDVILGGLALYQPHFPDWVREALPAIHELGAAALLTPEYRAQHPLPLFPPYPAPPLDEQAHVDVALDRLNEIVTGLGMRLLLEPITQFESRFWRDVPTVWQVCERLGNPHIGLALDFHNMNITEADMSTTIQQAGVWVHHVHLADNNRRLPGHGHIDFASGLAALRHIQYQGWYSFECAVEGDFATELQQTIQRLKQ